MRPHRNLLVILLFGSVLPLVQADNTSREDGYDRINNVEYGKVGEHRLLLDLYLPHDVEQAPLVIWIHGGAWRRGSKARMPLLFLVKQGYAIASVDYRLSPIAKFPAQIHDIKAAVRFMKATAAHWKVSADRIGVAGESAGGHLAALLGVTNGHQKLEGDIGVFPKESSDVHAIVDLFGPTNFMTILHQSTPHGLSVRVPALELLLGARPEKIQGLAKLASPVEHVNKKDPPLLMIHGDQDPQVPINQSHELHAKYKHLQLPVLFHVIHGGFHGGNNFYQDEPQQLITTFFNTHIRQN